MLAGNVVVCGFLSIQLSALAEGPSGLCFRGLGLVLAARCSMRNCVVIPAVTRMMSDIMRESAICEERIDVPNFMIRILRFTCCRWNEHLCADPADDFQGVDSL
jgi:hypothetical protein